MSTATTARIAIAALLAVAGVEAQTTPAPPPAFNSGGVRLNPIPTFVFGSQVGLGNRGVLVRRGFAGNSTNLGIANSPFLGGLYSGANGFLLNPGFGGLGSYYYWTPGTNRSVTPSGPSYANPGPVRAVEPQPAPLEAPAVTASSAEWADARVSFTAASARVSAARMAVEELRARLEALGQSPRANLLTGTAAAEAALKTAKDRMEAGALEESRREITRSSYLAGQVLKEFGR